MKPLRALFLLGAKEYLSSTTDSERGAIARDIEGLQAGDLTGIYTKQLRGPIRELKSGSHRIVYFKIKQDLYFVSGFRKKTTKTPKREIENAQKIYNQLT